MISIVIPSITESGKLRDKVVQSVLETTPSNVEYEIIFGTADAHYAVNVNKGLSRANGDKILILNDDAVLLPGWYEWISAANEGIISLTPRPDCGWGWAITRKMYEEVGKLDEQLINSYDDYDYFMRAAVKGYTRILAPSFFAVHDGGVTLTKKWGHVTQPKPERLMQCQANKDYMKQKWPNIDFNMPPLIYFAVHGVQIMKQWQEQNERV